MGEERMDHIDTQAIVGKHAYPRGTDLPRVQEPSSKHKDASAKGKREGILGKDELTNVHPHGQHTQASGQRTHRHPCGPPS